MIEGIAYTLFLAGCGWFARGAWEQHVALQARRDRHLTPAAPSRRGTPTSTER